MNIHPLSDLHHEFKRHSTTVLEDRDSFEKRKLLGSPIPGEFIQEINADVVVLAGDIDCDIYGVQWAIAESQVIKKPIIYVIGNHEYYDSEYHETLSKIRVLASGTDVHVLENDSIEINGTRFLGTTLWTDYKIYETWLDQTTAMTLIEKWIADHKCIHFNDRLFKSSDALSIHKQSVAWLKHEISKPFAGKTVVVTHHAPSPRCAHHEFGLNEMSVGFISNLECLMGDNVDLWIYGHTHSNLDTVVNGTRLISNQPGYPRETVPGFNRHLVISI